MRTRTIVEENPKNIAVLDVYSKLVQHRIIFVDGTITEELANEVVAQLLYLNYENPKEPIQMYINSPGGYIYDGLAIIDVMQRIDCDVNTVCVGKSMSFGAILLMLGKKRSIGANSTVMLHDCSNGFNGMMRDLEIDFNETKRLNSILHEIIKNHTNIKNPEEVCARDYYLDAEKAKELGIVDEILYKR